MTQELEYNAKVTDKAIDFIITPYINQIPGDKIYIIVRSDNSYFYDTAIYNPNTENINKKIVKAFLNDVLSFKNLNNKITSVMAFEKVNGLYKASKNYVKKDSEIKEQFLQDTTRSEFFIDTDDPSVMDYPSPFNVEEYYEQMYESEESYDGDSCSDENFKK